MPPVAFRCSAACQAFQLIGALLITYVMPPAVAAELFQALGDIPGVTVVHDAADSAGQRGVAFRMPLPAPDPAYEEFVINPRTYRFMGWVIPTDNGPGGKAVIRQALVADPGIRP
jgi:hypothetical protein